LTLSMANAKSSQMDEYIKASPQDRAWIEVQANKTMYDQKFGSVAKNGYDTMYVGNTITDLRRAAAIYDSFKSNKDVAKKSTDGTTFVPSTGTTPTSTQSSVPVKQTVQLNIVVPNVSDVDSFNRSKKQMAAGIKAELERIAS
jgi:hypothetical protein